MIQSRYKYASKIRLSPVHAIRSYCLNTCCAGSAKEVRLCTTPECPLYEYRFAKNSARCGIRVGPRDKKGRFLRTETPTTGPDLIMPPKEGMDKGVAVLTRPALNNREFEPPVEESQGKIQIKRTAAGLVISLTQAHKNKPYREGLLR